MKVLNIIQRYAPAIGGSEDWCQKVCSYMVSQGTITNVSTINLYHIEQGHKYFPLNKQNITLGSEDIIHAFYPPCSWVQKNTDGTNIYQQP